MFIGSKGFQPISFQLSGDGSPEQRFHVRRVAPAVIQIQRLQPVRSCCLRIEMLRTYPRHQPTCHTYGYPYGCPYGLVTSTSSKVSSPTPLRAGKEWSCFATACHFR